MAAAVKGLAAPVYARVNPAGMGSLTCPASFCRYCRVAMKARNKSVCLALTLPAPHDTILPVGQRDLPFDKNDSMWIIYTCVPLFLRHAAAATFAEFKLLPFQPSTACYKKEVSLEPTYEYQEPSSKKLRNFYYILAALGALFTLYCVYATSRSASSEDMLFICFMLLWFVWLITSIIMFFWGTAMKEYDFSNELPRFIVTGEPVSDKMLDDYFAELRAGMRRILLREVLIWAAILVCIMVAWGSGASAGQPFESSLFSKFLGTFSAFFSIFVILQSFAKNTSVRTIFKQLVVQSELLSLFPGAVYAPKEGFSEPMVEQDMLISTGNRYYTGDLLKAQYKGIPFQMADVLIQRVTQSGKHTVTTTFFSGQMVYIYLPHSFGSPFYIWSKEQHYTPRNHLHRNGLQPVAVEDSAFNDQYVISATDPLDVFRYLTPPIIEQLRNNGLYNITFDPVSLRFWGNQLLVGINNSQDLFETDILENTSTAEMRFLIRRDAQIVMDVIDAALQLP